MKICWSALAVLLALAGGVRAQDAPAQEPAAAAVEAAPTIPVETRSEPAQPADAEPGAPAQLDEVVVTATKRKASLREIPASIASLSGEDLERSGANGVEDIARHVPGVNIATENGVQRITIRGISAANNTNATTGVLFGNVSFIDAYLPVLSLDPLPFDLQNVEVLKGPQGTLFGASALNGAIRYVPEPARFGEFSAKYFAQYTRVEHGGAAPTYGAAVNLPVGDTLAVRLVGFERRQPGYIDNLRVNIDDSNKLEQSGARIMAGWHPGADWNISLTGAMQQTSIDDTALADNLDGQLSSDNRPRTSPTSNRYKLAVLNVEYDLGWASAVSESAWVNKHSHTYLENTRNKVPNAPVGLVAIDGGGDSDTYSQELRLVSADQPGDRWRWIAGVFASRQEIHEVVNLDAGNSTLPAALNGGLLDSLIPGLGQEVDAMGNVSLIDLNPHVTIRELALFGNVTRKLGDAWELTLGGRLYKTDSFGTNLQQGVVFTALNGSPQFVQHGGVAEHGFNPQLSLAWHATDELMSYATVAKGFRVGGLQPGITLPTSKTQAPPTFKSDTIWSYELGQRTSWFGRTLNVDVAAFHIDWKNPQVQQPDSTSGVAYLDNAGGVKSDGAELNLRWLTPVGLMLSSGMTYAKTVTTEPFLSGTGQMSMPGDPWPYAPRLQTSTTLAYPLDLAGWVVTPSLTHAYLGKTVNNLGEQKPIFNYHQLDAQIGLANPQWSWAPQLTISVNNVLDTRGVTTNVTQGPSTDVNYCQPRTLIVHLGGQF